MYFFLNKLLLLLLTSVSRCGRGCAEGAGVGWADSFEARIEVWHAGVARHSHGAGTVRKKKTIIKEHKLMDKNLEGK